MGYIPLHVHTYWSLLDGLMTIDQYISRAKEYNIPALAITDHGTLAGVPEFYQKCRQNDIKPIIGCEFYFTPDIGIRERDKIFHLTLLARSEEGYRNLLRLSSFSYEEGFYYKPRIDFASLEKHREGLICLTGCPAGMIPRAIMQGEMEEARETLEKLLSLFKEDLYVEVMDHGLDFQQVINEGLIELAEEKGLPVVPTNDTHYLDKADSEIHRILLGIQVGKTLQQIEERGDFEGYWKSSEFYFKKAEDFNFDNSLLKNTYLVADKCSITIPELEKTDYKFPEVGISSTKYIWAKCLKRLLEEFGSSREYYERMRYELEVIEKLGFMDYFYIIKDIIDFCDKNGIPRGVARGSVGGSLVAYLLGITNVDPLKYNTLFERFLNPDRVSLPDIDLDISKSRRQEVVEYLYQKYGRDKVAHIGTYGTIELKTAIRDVARVKYGMVYDTKQISNDSSLEELLASTSDVTEKHIFTIADKLRKLKRHGSTHAAGLIISPIPIREIVPLRVDKGEVVTQWEMEDIERVGLVKFDLLGLRTVDVIDSTVKLVKERHGVEIDINNLPFDDKKTWKLLREGRTKGVFQFEGSGIAKLIKDMKVSEFEDLVAANALS